MIITMYWSAHPRFRWSKQSRPDANTIQEQSPLLSPFLEKKRILEKTSNLNYSYSYIR